MNIYLIYYHESFKSIPSLIFSFDQITSLTLRLNKNTHFWPHGSPSL